MLEKFKFGDSVQFANFAKFSLLPRLIDKQYFNGCLTKLDGDC